MPGVGYAPDPAPPRTNGTFVTPPSSRTRDLRPTASEATMPTVVMPSLPMTPPYWLSDETPVSFDDAILPRMMLST